MTGPLQYIDLSQPSLWIAVGSILFVCLLVHLSDGSRRRGSSFSEQGATGPNLLFDQRFPEPALLEHCRPPR